MDSKKRPSALNRPPIQLEEGKRPPPPVATDMTAEQVDNLLRLWQVLGAAPNYQERLHIISPPKEADDGL